MVLVPKFLGGSSGKAGDTLPDASLPPDPSTTSQNVHRDSAGAFGILEVSACRKYHLLTGEWSIAPANMMNSPRRSPPATSMSEMRPKRPPGVVRSCQAGGKYWSTYVLPW